jgi:hypothetical protein
LCKEETDPQTFGFDEFNPDNVFNNDCSDPTNASNPMCQDICSRPGAENNPICRSNSSQTSISSNTGETADYGGEGQSAPGMLDMGDGDLEQQAQFSSLGQDPSQANGVPNGGGGMPGGGGDGSFGGGDGAGGGSGPGYDTDILNGTSRGGGYTSSMSYGGGGGGFKGYGQGGNRRPTSAKGESFDLKKFLPGAKMNGVGAHKGSGTHRGPASGIGGKHQDIFKMISNAYRRLCLTGQLYDCSAIVVVD